MVEAPQLNGRRVIYSPIEEVNAGNIIEVLEKAMPVHLKNAQEERYLFNRYRGITPIRGKTKETRKSINHRVREAREVQIVDFWSGTMAGDPIIYTMSRESTKSTDDLVKLNRYMRLAGKPSADKRLFDWMHITGHGYMMVKHKDNFDEDEAPFDIYVLNPFNTFVVYNANVGNRRLLGAVYFIDEDRNEIMTCYTPTERFVIVNRREIRSISTNGYGIIPIFEFRLNEACMGAFEPAVDLIDAAEYLDSDRMDSVTSFVNSLIVLYNARLPDGETSETVRDNGLICLSSTGDVKSDIKILSEQLDQTSSQTLKDDIYASILQICAVPNMGTGNTSDSSNNGAQFLKAGYQITEIRAKSEENQYKYFANEQTKLIVKICRELAGLDINTSDIDITFTRHVYSDIQSKAMVFSTLVGTNYVNPLDAWNISGLVNDPEAAYERGMEFRESVQEEAAKQAEAQAAMNIGGESGSGQSIEGNTEETANAGAGT